MTGKAASAHPVPPVRWLAGGRLKLGALVLIRWIAFVGQAVTLSFVKFGLGFQFPYVEAMAVVLLLGFVNVAIILVRPRQTWLSDRDAALTLGFDLVQLAVLLGLTGGLFNPFALLIMAPLAVAAWVLTGRSIVILAALAVGLVSLLALWHLPLPGLEPHFPNSPLYTFALWVALVIAIVFTTAYVSFVAGETRRMSEAVASMQLALAREQHLSSLGGLAAAAAHELGSPLGTIAVVARELQRDLAPDSPMREDVDMIVEESKRCRRILARLAARPEEDRGHIYNRVPLSALVESAARPFETEGVEISLQTGQSAGAQPTVRRNPEIVHALGTLIQNAVQFARDRVVLETGWSETEVRVVIRDDGPGFDPMLVSRLGEPYYSTGGVDARGSASHMGLGIFIARTLLAHNGATVSFGNAKDGGAQVEILWDRASLEQREEGSSSTAAVRDRI